jgi:hypothetical protein
MKLFSKLALAAMILFITAAVIVSSPVLVVAFSVLATVMFTAAILSLCAIAGMFGRGRVPPSVIVTPEPVSVYAPRRATVMAPSPVYGPTPVIATPSSASRRGGTVHEHPSQTAFNTHSMFRRDQHTSAHIHTHSENTRMVRNHPRNF